MPVSPNDHVNMDQSSDDVFRRIFDEAPVSLWVEDLSDVKRFIERVRTSGTDNLRTHFENHPEAVSACAKKVKIIQVNKATLDLYKAGSKEQLLDGIETTFTEESREAFREALLALAEGGISIASEAIAKTLTGGPVHILIHISNTLTASSPDGTDRGSLSIRGKPDTERAWRNRSIG